MTANKAAFAAEIEICGLSARRAVGVAFACIFAVSCSASGGDTAYDLLANGEETAALEDTDKMAVLPSFRPADAPDGTTAHKDGGKSQSQAPQAVVAEAATEAVEPTDGAQEDDLSAEGAGGEETVAQVETTPDHNAASTQEMSEPQDAAAADADAATASPEQDMAENDDGNPSGTQKRSLLSAFFAPSRKKPPFPDTSVLSKEEEEEADSARERPVVSLASASSPVTASLAGGNALPGVRGSDQLFDISSKSGIHDEDSLDLYEAADGSYQVASAAGLARLAPNGLIRQREDVDVSCFKPELVRLLKIIERRFGKRIMVTSGYRSPAHNKRVRGAPKSMHMHCAAADIQLKGVGKWELARYVRSLPGRGGVGTYCHTKSVHVDVGPQRDWNWNCRR